MPKYKVEVCRPWLQMGTVIVEADSVVAANDLVENFSFAEEEQIEWNSPEIHHNGSLHVDFVTELP